MIRLVGKKLIIPRGDTGSFSIPVLSTFNNSDIAIFSILNPRTNKIVLSLTCTEDNEILTINFTHSDTVNLPIGKFVWDIKYYKDPVFEDNVLIDGVEIDSYYAAYTLPICEIRQTGDKLLTANDNNTSVLNSESFNLLNATLNEVRDANNALQQYKGEIQTMLHQEERIETLENTLQGLITNLQSLRNRLQQHISEVDTMFNQEERLETAQNTISLIENSIENINNEIQTLTTALNNLKQAPENIKDGASTGSIIEGKITGDEANRASQYAHAEGEYTIAQGVASHSEGRYATYTDSNTSQLVTQPTAAYSLASHAEGEGTIASGNAAHSEGKLTQASGITAHAEGAKTVAYGNSSHAEGQGTYAKHWAQHVFGLYNAQDPSTEQSHRRGNYIEIVGNGQGDNSRSNARTLDWSGNEVLKGNITLGQGTSDEVTLTAAQVKALLALLQ